MSKNGEVKIPLQDYLTLLEIEKGVVENSTLIMNMFGDHISSVIRINTDEHGKNLLEEIKSKNDSIVCLNREIESNQIKISNLKAFGSEKNNIINNIPKWIVNLFNKEK